MQAKVASSNRCQQPARTCAVSAEIRFERAAPVNHVPRSARILAIVRADSAATGGPPHRIDLVWCRFRAATQIHERSQAPSQQNDAVRLPWHPTGRCRRTHIQAVLLQRTTAKDCITGSGRLEAEVELKFRLPILQDRRGCILYLRGIEIDGSDRAKFRCARAPVPGLNLYRQYHRLNWSG